MNAQKERASASTPRPLQESVHAWAAEHSGDTPNLDRYQDRTAIPEIDWLIDQVRGEERRYARRQLLLRRLALSLEVKRENLVALGELTGSGG